MKKIYWKIVVFTLICASMFVTGCKKDPVKPKTVLGTKTATAISEGMKVRDGIDLVFDDEMAGFTISKVPFSDVHDSVDCDKCGIVDLDGTKAYKFDNSDHNKSGSGLLITLNTPIKADLLSGMFFTLKTSDNETSNVIRVGRYDATSRGEYQNDSPSFENKKDEWTTINIGVESMESLADAQGYIQGFSFHIRSYDHTDFYISKISLKADFESICNPGLEPGRCMQEQDAVDHIAESIKNRLQKSGIGATVNVACEEYTANTTVYEGSIKYYVDLEFDGKIFTTDFITRTIPVAKNVWLNTKPTDNSNVKLADSGILNIDKIKIDSNENAEFVEYACIAEDKNFHDNDIVWFAAHKAQVGDSKIKKVFINPFLDYGQELVEGSNYRLVVRTVTDKSNYIYNFDKLFTYNSHDSELCQLMIQAISYVNQAYVVCGTSNKSETVKQKLEEGLDDRLSVDVVCTGEGLNASNFTVVIKGAKDSAFKYRGQAFIVKKVVAWHDPNMQAPSISLVSPIDGQTDIVLAQDRIISHFKNPYSVVINPDYELYSAAEVCTPPAISFKWQDTNTDTEQRYELLIADNITFENATVYKTTETSYDVYNLQPGKQYYWKVCSADRESSVFTFTVDDGYTRFLKVSGVFNIRDLGGYINSNGKRVKYGLLYRSANMDGIDREGMTELKKKLGVKTDVDYRGDQGRSPLGVDVNYIPVAIKWYHGIFAEEALPLIREAIALHAVEENYPMVFHCAIGRDRTGTMSFLMLGLLGVDEETLVREYHLSFYSQMGSFSASNHKSLYEGNILYFIKGLREYGDEDDTLNECIEKFALAIGVTKDEINSIRNILLEDAPPAKDIMQEEQTHEKSGCSGNSAVAQIMFLFAAVLVIKKKSSCQ